MSNCFFVEKVLAYDGIILDVASTSVKQQSFMQSSDCDSRSGRRRSLETIVPSQKDDGNSSNCMMFTQIPLNPPMSTFERVVRVLSGKERRPLYADDPFWLKMIPFLVCFAFFYVHFMPVYLNLVEMNQINGNR